MTIGKMKAMREFIANDSPPTLGVSPEALTV